MEKKKKYCFENGLDLDLELSRKIRSLSTSIFTCLHFCGFDKMGNFTRVYIGVLSAICSWDLPLITYSHLGEGVKSLLHFYCVLHAKNGVDGSR